MKKRFRKKVLTVFLSFLFLVGLMPTTAFAANETDTWDGTADTSWYTDGSTEFHITTAEQLAGMAKLINEGTTYFSNTTVYLDNDLDLSGHEWISIGNESDKNYGSFQGVFDGQNNVIYNLYSHEGVLSGDNENNPYRNGLFGSIYNATVKNLGIENADIVIPMDDISTYGKGILVDWMTNSNIVNCYTTGSITGGSYIEKYIAGIAGILNGANNNIIQCYSTATITGNYEGGYYEENDVDPMTYWDSLGGIVGASYVGTTTISDCWFGGEIVVNSIQAPVGGIIGYGEGVSIKNCLVASKKIGNDGQGNTCWLGYVLDTDAENCFWPNDDTYASNVSNAMNEVSAGTAVDNFTDGSLLEALNANTESGAEWVQGINNPTFSWDKRNIAADYSKVNEAIAKTEALNPDEYANFSVVEAAINGVVWDKNITEQAEVNAMAKSIEDAIASLEYKSADYSKVNEMIAKANALNKNEYKDFSDVEAAISAVVWDKNITEQAEVNAMAKAIEDAIKSLEKKDISTSTEPAKPTDQQDKTTGSPQTGDNSHIVLWTTVMLAAGIVLTGGLLYNRKKKYSK